MNIWLMNHYATGMFFDKAGRHYWFAKKLTERGNKATVFCANTFLNKLESVETNGSKYTVKETDNILFTFVKTPTYQGNGISRIRNMFSFYINMFPVSKAIAKEYEKPDIIIASSVHPLTMVAGIQIAKRMKVPCICEVRDLWPEAIFAYGRAKESSLLGKMLLKGEHWIYKKASALIFTKEGDTDYLKERKWTTDLGGDIDLNKCFYINNGIDIASFDRQKEKETIKDEDLEDKEAFNVIYAGTIRAVNNVGNILDCAKIIKENEINRNIKFIIYGEGNELDLLRKRVDEEGISNVKFKGFIERKYIPYVLSKASVNLLNYSQNEFNWARGNSSNKLFEYMASGKPIISTVKMGYSIIKKYDCGTELDECSPSALAEAIIRFYDASPSEHQRIGNNARTGAYDFDFEKHTDKLCTVIESVLNKRL